MNELKTFTSYRPDVQALSSTERDDLWRRVTGEPSASPQQRLIPAATSVDVGIAARATLRPPHRRPARIGAAALAVAAAAAALVVVLDGRSGSEPASSPPLTQPVATSTTSPPPPTVAAFGTPPRLLVSGGWRLSYYNESGPGAGDFEFASTTHGADITADTTVITADNGDVLASEVTQPTGVIQGMWTPYDRAKDWDSTTVDAPTSVAGHPTQIFQNGPDMYVAIISTGDGSIELRVPAASRAALDALLADVHAATIDEFEAALPDSVVSPQERAAVIAEMLTDVPLPAGVDTTPLAAQTIYSDRVTLATNVAQLAVCAWLDRWFDSKDSDPVRRDEALDALESSHHWTMLTNMDPRQSGYPAALWETIDTLRVGGTVSSGAGPIPITRSDAEESLGCNW